VSGEKENLVASWNDMSWAGLDQNRGTGSLVHTEGYQRGASVQEQHTAV